MHGQAAALSCISAPSFDLAISGITDIVMTPESFFCKLFASAGA